jgi:hypothetical protein
VAQRCALERQKGRTHDPLAMQKVESSSLFIRSENRRKRRFSFWLCRSGLNCFLPIFSPSNGQSHDVRIPYGPSYSSLTHAFGLDAWVRCVRGAGSGRAVRASVVPRHSGHRTREGGEANASHLATHWLGGIRPSEGLTRLNRHGPTCVYPTSVAYSQMKERGPRVFTT